MPLTCDNNGTNCRKRFSTEKTKDTNVIIGIILGSIALAIVVLLLIAIMYMVYCKRYFRTRVKSRSRSHPSSHNQEQPTSMGPDYQQPQLNPRKLSNEPPSTYHEANTDDHVKPNKAS
jgi:hypothetical protein